MPIADPRQAPGRAPGRAPGKALITALAALLLLAGPVWADTAPVDPPQDLARQGAVLEVTALGHYLAPAGANQDIAQAFADFEARLAAVRQAMVPLLQGGHIAFDRAQQMEITVLAAGLVDTDYVSRSCARTPDGLLCASAVRCLVRPIDFLQAETQNYRLDKLDDPSDFLQELEPEIPDQAQPGLFLSKAYRELSRGRLRPAYLYLDRVLRRHPNWTSALRALAETEALMGENEAARELYSRACGLGDQRSCDALPGQ